MSSEIPAVIFLIDNSPTSINGDFFPNRLDAQKLAVETLALSVLRDSAKAQVGIGTLSQPNFGIIASLSTEEKMVREALTNVHMGTHPVKLMSGIRCALLALRHRSEEVNFQRIVILLHSSHDLPSEQAEQFAAFANQQGVAVDIAVFGDDEIDREALSKYTASLGIKSNFVEILDNSETLSDSLYRSDIGKGPNAQPLAAADDFDENIQMALRLSLEEQSLNNGTPAPTANVIRPGSDETDQELQAALQASMEDDPALQEALRLSALEHEEAQRAAIAAASTEEAAPKPAEEKPVEEEEMDEELLAAIEASKAVSVEEEMNEEPKATNEASNEIPTEEEEVDPELLEAIRLSKETSAQEQEEKDAHELLERIRQQMPQLLEDHDALHSYLSTLPGVDPNDPRFYKK